VTSRVTEAGNLLGLSQQVGDRVEDEVHERELSWGACGSHVSNDDGDRAFINFGAQFVDHGDGQLDSGDRHTALGQGDSHSASAYGELECSALTCELGESLDGRLQHLGSEHSGAWGVVRSGSVFVPNLFLAHGIHLGSGCPAAPNDYPSPAHNHRRAL